MVELTVELKEQSLAVLLVARLVADSAESSVV